MTIGEHFLLRWLPVVFAGVFLGGVIHILLIMSIPSNAPDNVFDRISRLGEDAKFNLISNQGALNEQLPMLDPAMAHATCQYELSNGPLEVETSLNVAFWSLALFNAKGEAFYSLNDRTAGHGQLKMLILTSAQLSLLRERPPKDLDSMIIIETDAEKGFLLLRAFVPDNFHRPMIEEAMITSTCHYL